MEATPLEGGPEGTCVLNLSADSKAQHLGRKSEMCSKVDVCSHLEIISLRQLRKQERTPIDGTHLGT